jgi:hypothetical protein
MTRSSYEPESPVHNGVDAAASLTVVTLDDRVQVGIPEADMDLQADIEADLNAASAPPSTLKKRGRPSLAGLVSTTPAKSVSARTPRSTASAAPKSAGRSTGKRKAAESEPEEEGEHESTPAAKRGRPGRPAGAAASARLSPKAAKKPTRGRPKSATVSYITGFTSSSYGANKSNKTAAKSATKAKKGGRPKKDTTSDEIPAGEYEVEAIVDAVIDADTHKHMFLVKWKGYPESANTWEPKINLHADDLVHKILAELKKAKAAAAAAEKAAKKVTAKKATAAASGDEKTTATRGRRAKAAPKAVKPVKAAKKAPGRPGRKRRARA